MPYPQFDRSKLRLQPLANRQHDLTLDILQPLDAPVAFDHPSVPVIGRRMAEAKAKGAARVLMMGAHVLRAGTQLHLIDLMERGLVSLIRANTCSYSVVSALISFAILSAASSLFCPLRRRRHSMSIPRTRQRSPV